MQLICHDGAAYTKSAFLISLLHTCDVTAVDAAFCCYSVGKWASPHSLFETQLPLMA
jgi:hypothetical protein